MLNKQAAAEQNRVEMEPSRSLLEQPTVSAMLKAGTAGLGPAWGVWAACQEEAREGGRC